jgi:hypothetical protein
LSPGARDQAKADVFDYVEWFYNLLRRSTLGFTWRCFRKTGRVNSG